MRTTLRWLLPLTALTLGVPTATHGQTRPRTVSSVPRAPTPYEAHQDSLVARIRRDGRTPRGVLPLLELFRDYGNVDPVRTEGMLAGLAADDRLDPAVSALASQLLARAQLRRGDLDGSRQTLVRLGAIVNFRAVGPFDNEGKTGFAREFEPEALRMAPIDRTARFEGRERPVGWRDLPAGHLGYVNFDAVFRPDTHVCGYAETFVESPTAQALTLWLGGGGATAAFWNGQEVLRDDHYRHPDPDRFAVAVGAHAGPNRLLLKACVAESTWGVFARITDARGRPLVLTSSTDAAVERVHAGHGVARLAAPPTTALASFESAARATPPDPQALEDLARFLAYTGADDPAEQRAHQLAERAATLAPTLSRLLLAAELAPSRSIASRWLDRAATLAPEDPDVLLARARFALGGSEPESARGLLARLPPAGRHHLEGAILEAELLARFDLPEAALRVVRDAAREAPRAPAWADRLADATDAVGRRTQAIELHRQSLGLRGDQQGTRELLIGDAIERGDRAFALEEIERYRAYSPDSVLRLVRVAGWYESLGEDDDAMAQLRLARELAPEDAEGHVATGRALLRAGQDEAALAVLRRAIELRPQDAETRDLLDHLEPRARPDESFAVPADTFLARRREDLSYPTHILEDLTVNTVFESGLGSVYRQVAIEARTDEGARSLRSFPIQYDPDVQRVEVRAAAIHRAGRVIEAFDTYEQPLGEPWYRIYYDTRALVVTFPDLEPGDVIEIRYRVDDIAERNRFDDYYGDLHFLAGEAPVARFDYVLLTPASRTFHFNTPSLPGLTRDERTEAGRRIVHLHADAIPAAHVEPSAPGATETRPYVHVSTYASWDEVGRWWWGLVRDQLYADEPLRRVVRELVSDAPDTRTKVQRIYRWVIDHTRYVGLEFGIHGFLPYRVPQIVERGFGDCKDKASLLYTMLREAGIDARLVLVRTRRNGAIHDLPASLAVFDHAIAYVPELDLYLDGTAEFSGTTELPQMDQGVTVLVVGPDGAELRRSPVMTPDHNARERSLVVDLARDGSARVEFDERVRGHEAPGWRARYQADSTRRDRFESQLRAPFPGIEVEGVTMEGLTDYESPVRAHGRAHVAQFATPDADGLRVPLSVASDLVRSLARTEARTQPLDLDATVRYVEQRTLRIPAGMRALSTPAPTRVESPFGTLTIATEASARQVVVRTELTIDRDRIEASEYPAFRDFVQRMDGALRQRVVIGGGR